MSEVVLAVSLDIVDAIPAVLAFGIASACLVVLAVGALVSSFGALLKVIGR